MRYLIFAIGVVLVILQFIFAQGARYVSPTGDDNNDGTTPDHPWKTLSYALSHLTSDVETLYLMDGTFPVNDPLYIPDNGSASLTIRNYPGASPVITGDEILNWTSESDGRWSVSGVNWEVRIVVEDSRVLVLKSSENDLTAGSWYYDQSNQKLWLKTSDGGNPNSDHTIHVGHYPLDMWDALLNSDTRTHVTIDGITIKYSNGVGLQIDKPYHTIRNCQVYYAFREGILAYTSADNVTIRNNEVAWSAYTRAYVDFNSLGWEGAEPLAVYGADIDVQYNTVHDNFGEGLDVQYGAGPGTVSHNTCYNNAITNFYLDSAHDITAEYNTIYYSTNPYDQFADYPYNDIGHYYECVDIGVETVDCYNNIFRFNIVDGGGWVDYLLSMYSQESSEQNGVVNHCRNNQIVSNTFVRGQNGLYLWQDASDRVHDNIYENNIFAECNTVITTEANNGANHPTNNTFQYNDWYDDSGIVFQWDGSNYNSLSAWQAASGKGNGAISADPLFVDLASRNLDLQAASPCIDRGNPASSVPSGGGWRIDMGAREYTGNVVTRSIDGTGEYTFGGTRVKLLVTSDNFSSIQVEKHSGLHPQAPGSVQGYYTITPTGSGTVDIILYYDDADLNGETESALRLWRYTGSGWDGPYFSSRDATENWVRANGISSFSDWVLSDAQDDQSLPVHLLFFQATWQQGKVQLQWATASEVNTAYFTIYRKIPGEDFRKLAQVPARGNSTSGGEYTWTDFTPPADTLCTYRLTEVTLSGEEYLLRETNVSTHTIITDFYLENPYPNPFNSTVQIRFRVPKEEWVHLSVWNPSGQKVADLWQGTVPRGVHQIAWDARDIASGRYFIRLQSHSHSCMKPVTLIR